MNRTEGNLPCNWITRWILSLVVSVGFAGITFAAQFDAPFLKVLEDNKTKWSKEDKSLDEKLAALEKKFGKKPNIIFILSDDIGWGELGSYGGGKVRGTPTPNLDKMAAEGMKFLSNYTEPACTPTRVALMTGRIPVRTGTADVLWPGEKEGLHPDEVTIAELLSDAGYETAMWGKWHVGESEAQSPEAQGFDQSFYMLYNGAAFVWTKDSTEHYKADVINSIPYFLDVPEDYEERFGISLDVGIMRGKKGQGRTPAGGLSVKELDEFEAISEKEVIQYVKDHAKSPKPFFVYWATNSVQLMYSPKETRHDPGVDSPNNNAAILARHDKAVHELLKTLRDEGIAENTLVVWVSDNGPMYDFYPIGGYSWLRGAKGETLDGGVRTPGLAWWPGTIEAGQDPMDIIHVTDWYTTMARIGGAKGAIPTDRITDGIDQTALVLQGEGHGRRDYMFHYNGNRLEAVRMGDLKMHLAGAALKPAIYNIIRDPGEKTPGGAAFLWAVAPFKNLIRSHMMMSHQFPHRQINMPPKGK